MRPTLVPECLSISFSAPEVCPTVMRAKLSLNCSYLSSDRHRDILGSVVVLEILGTSSRNRGLHRHCTELSATRCSIGRRAHTCHAVSLRCLTGGARSGRYVPYIWVVRLRIRVPRSLLHSSQVTLLSRLARRATGAYKGHPQSLGPEGHTTPTSAACYFTRQRRAVHGEMQWSCLDAPR